MNTLELGKIGENLAAEHLQAKGYRIAVRNFRAGRGEIDIIAWAPEGRLLVFIEVKTRKNDRFGGPEEAVTRKKQQMIARAAGAYMLQTGYDWAIRFDTIAVLLDDGRLREIRHIEDAFFLYE
jgi:putative endonuclease